MHPKRRLLPQLSLLSMPVPSSHLQQLSSLPDILPIRKMTDTHCDPASLQ